MDALTRSWKEGHDIITMSVGAASGFAATASGIVVERIAAAGTIVTLSAGNEVRIFSFNLSTMLIEVIGTFGCVVYKQSCGRQARYLCGECQ